MVLPLLSSACGSKATADDCDRIVTRIAELELRAAGVQDPNALAERVTSTKAAFREKAMTQCVGKRITETTKHCIEQATSSSEILEQCLE